MPSNIRYVAQPFAHTMYEHEVLLGARYQTSHYFNGAMRLFRSTESGRDSEVESAVEYIPFCRIRLHLLGPASARMRTF